MIGNDDGRKNNVIIQWVSREYMMNNKKDLRDIPVGPDEYYVLIKEGEVVEIETQKQVNAVPNIFRRFADWLGKTKDVQLVIMDVRKHELEIPFEAFTSDRGQIRGKANLEFRINPDDCVRALRLLKEDNPFGDINSTKGFREFCIEDVSALLGNNLQYVIDTDSISRYKMEEIHSKRNEISQDLVTSLNKNTPYWANYGLSVAYSSIKIDENAYEELERRRTNGRMETLRRELEYAEMSGDLEHKTRINALVNRENSAREIDNYLSVANTNAAKEDYERNRKHAVEISNIQNKHEIDSTLLQNINDLEMRKKEHQVRLKQIDDSMEINDAKKRIELKRIENEIRKLDLDLDKAEREYEMELERQRKMEEERLRQEKIAFDVAMREKELEMKNNFIKETMKMDHDHIENMTVLGNDVKLAEIKADVEKTNAMCSSDLVKAQTQADMAIKANDQLRDDIDKQHARSMDSLDKYTGLVGAVQGKTPQATLVCPRCNQALNGKSKYCVGCGAKLEWDE